ncbi:MAG: TusE/DsrC/DsvC family sulfur relay protein [Candidatus Moduliflexus flocculans]|nr:TusE/DsrC/DsvC family sulfur relay protein [Candidatus Moduliflexus flocculans]
MIRFIRGHLLRKRSSPRWSGPFAVTTNLQLRHTYELFPSGPAKGARKLAGLPKPDGCV